jgi:hypothetical protein
MEDSSHTDEEDTSIFDSHDEGIFDSHDESWQGGKDEDDSPFKSAVAAEPADAEDLSGDYELRKEEEPSAWESLKSEMKANKGTAIGIIALVLVIPGWLIKQHMGSADDAPKSTVASAQRHAGPVALNPPSASASAASAPAQSAPPPPSASATSSNASPSPSQSTSAPASPPSSPQEQSPALITPLKVGPESCPSPDGSADLAVDGKLDTAWVCQMRFNRNGQILDIILPGKYVVTQVCIDPGYDKRNNDGTDEYMRHRVPTTVVYDFGDGHRVTQNAGSNRGLVCQDIPNFTATTIQVLVKQTAVPQDPGGTGGYSGGQGDKQDFAISEVQATGYPSP